MNKLEIKRKQIIDKYNDSITLQKYRNLDFPDNTTLFFENNYYLFNNYFNNIVKKSDYYARTDTILKTLIYNFVSSFKAYLNRKKRKIEKVGDSKYKIFLLKIIEKYWTPKKNIRTNIDRVIEIRDILEHDNTKGFLIKKLVYLDHEITSIFYNDTNINQLFEDAIKEIKNMSVELEAYIENTLNEIDTRDCILFINAFNRKVGIPDIILLYPEPTNDELNKYKCIIEDLSKE